MLIGTRCACGTARRYFHHDGLGSVVAMTDDAGAQSHNYVYDPYGNLTSVTEANTNQFRYAGGWQHGGIYHFGERLYEPGLGRWTQMDPLNQLRHRRRQIKGWWSRRTGVHRKMQNRRRSRLDACEVRSDGSGP